LFDRKVTLNVTYFDTTYKNLQAQTIETVGGLQNFRLTNVGKLGTHGFEIDAGYRPNSTFNFNTSLAILDAKYLDYPVAQCFAGQTAAQGCVAGTPSSQNLTGTQAVQAPKFKMSLTAEYTPQITEAAWPGPDQCAASEQRFYSARDPQTFQKSYEIVNFNLGVRDEDRRWEVAAFVNNLFDQQYYPSLINNNGQLGRGDDDAGRPAARLPSLWRDPRQPELLIRTGRTVGQTARPFRAFSTFGNVSPASHHWRHYAQGQSTRHFLRSPDLGQLSRSGRSGARCAAAGHDCQ
jgi:iron complex outermembrane receptor protein